jgi:hypothetical protein
MTEKIVISDKFRAPIVAIKQSDGVVIRTPAAWIRLTDAELDRLFAFANDRPHIQRHPVMASESRQGDEITPP